MAPVSRRELFYSLIVIAVVVALARSASASCPANGNTHAIYITSNMGDNIWSFDTQGNYLGEVINKESIPNGVRVDKLRAMRFGPGGHLYVLSARGSYSRVFAISGNGLLNHTMQKNCTRDYLFTVAAQSSSDPFLDHPYDLLFHPETNDLYVSNQNSVSVTRYTYKPGKNGEPAWEAAANAKVALPSGKAGTAWQEQQKGAVVSAANAAGGPVTHVGVEQDTPEVDVPDKIPENAGLFVSGWNGKYYLNSVRGMALSPKLPSSLVDGSAPAGLFTMDNTTTMSYYLLVCDIVTSVVHVFDPDSGERLFGLWVPTPVQVMFPARFYREEVITQTASGAKVIQVEQPYVFVSSKEDAMTYMVRFSSRSTAKGPAQTQTGVFRDDSYVPTHRMVPITAPTPLHASSGIYENPSRDIILTADRNGRRVSSYASPFAHGGYDPAREPGPSDFLGFFVKRLPDQPEFVLSVVLETQKSLPFCYELGPDGNLRYVALCTAAHIWSIALLVVLILVPAMLLYKQGKHCLRERRRKEKLRHAQEEAASNDAVTPLLTASQTRPSGSGEREQSPLLKASSTAGRPNYGTS